MTDNAYYVWFLATALAVTVILTIGTLAAADLLPRRDEAPEESPTGRDRDRHGQELSPRR